MTNFILTPFCETDCKKTIINHVISIIGLYVLNICITFDCVTSKTLYAKLNDIVSHTFYYLIWIQICLKIKRFKIDIFLGINFHILTSVYVSMLVNDIFCLDTGHFMW